MLIIKWVFIKCMTTLHKNPTFEFEEQYWRAGILHIAGIDEVGMGALAGPVVAGAVIFKSPVDIPLLRDSKLLSPKQRREVGEEIRAHALSFATGEASVTEIDTLNIRKASHMAMRRAIDALSLSPDVILLDGTPAQIHESIPTTNIIKGDRLCCSIAAASIIAKLYRDEFMLRLDSEFPLYGFASHKGYGAPTHLEALKVHGPSPWHRRSYAPVAAVLKVGNEEIRS